jgi:hypothetical protein
MVNPCTVSAESKTKPLHVIAAVCGAHKSPSRTPTVPAKTSRVHPSNTVAKGGGLDLDVGTREKFFGAVRKGIDAAFSQKADTPPLTALSLLEPLLPARARSAQSSLAIFRI